MSHTDNASPIQDPLSSLRSHPVFPVADILARYLGLPRSLVQLVQYFSLAAGRMVTPIHLEIISDSWDVDLHVANAILDLLHENVPRVDTHRQLRALERKDFNGLAAILIRGDHPFLFRNATEYTARLTLSDFYLPSVWRVTERPLTLPSVASTLRLHVSRDSDAEQSGAAARDIDYFGESFATLVCTGDDEFLAEIILQLPQQPTYDCPFRERYRRTVGPSMMLVFERLLLVLTALRIQWATSADRRREITPADYYAARSLLTTLPLVPIDRRLSPSALKTAETIFDSIQRTGHQLTLPDRSSEGYGWFTRKDAKDWTGLSYTSVKKHLQELEDEGLLLSTLHQNSRDYGKQIHFRFRPGEGPPFGWRNPFDGLPESIDATPNRKEAARTETDSHQFTPGSHHPGAIASGPGQGACVENRAVHTRPVIHEEIPCSMKVRPKAGLGPWTTDAHAP